MSMEGSSWQTPTPKQQLPRTETTQSPELLKKDERRKKKIPKTSKKKKKKKISITTPNQITQSLAGPY